VENRHRDSILIQFADILGHKKVLEMQGRVRDADGHVKVISLQNRFREILHLFQHISETF
jgi:hypothetical protein